MREELRVSIPSFRQPIRTTIPMKVDLGTALCWKRPRTRTTRRVLHLVSLSAKLVLLQLPLAAGSNRRHKVRRTDGDAILISLMGGGKTPRVAVEAERSLLVSDQSGDSHRDDADTVTESEDDGSDLDSQDPDEPAARQAGCRQRTPRESVPPERMSTDPGSPPAVDDRTRGNNAVRTGDDSPPEDRMSIDRDDEPPQPHERAPSGPRPSLNHPQVTGPDRSYDPWRCRAWRPPR